MNIIIVWVLLLGLLFVSSWVWLKICSWFSSCMMVMRMSVWCSVGSVMKWKDCQWLVLFRVVVLYRLCGICCKVVRMSVIGRLMFYQSVIRVMKGSVRCLFESGVRLGRLSNVRFWFRSLWLGNSIRCQISVIIVIDSMLDVKKVLCSQVFSFFGWFSISVSVSFRLMKVGVYRVVNSMVLVVLCRKILFLSRFRKLVRFMNCFLLVSRFIVFIDSQKFFSIGVVSRFRQQVMKGVMKVQFIQLGGVKVDWLKFMLVFM